MPYISRNAEGALISPHVEAAVDALDFLPDEHAEVQAFVGRSGEFEQLDADFIRVLEDLIDLLISNRVINATDLPADARKKLFVRKGLHSPTALGERSELDGGPAPDFGRLA